MQACSRATKRLRQQNQQFKDSLGYMVKLSKQNEIRKESEGERRGGRGRGEGEAGKGRKATKSKVIEKER